MKKIFLFLLIFSAWVFLLNLGLTKHEKNECRTWERQTEKIQNFFLTSAQERQCRALGFNPTNWKRYYSTEKEAPGFLGLTR